MERYTKYERARIIGARSLQLSMGAPFMMGLSKTELGNMRFSTLEIAKLEFRKGLIPITVKRPMPIQDHETIHDKTGGARPHGKESSKEVKEIG